VTGRNVAHKPPVGDTVVLLDRDASVQRVGFNDLTADERGRVYVGALGVVAIEADLNDPHLPSGCLYLIETDGTARIVADDIRLTNGVAISPDGRRLYLADSGRRMVFQFDVDMSTGDLRNRQPYLEDTEGVPDGIAVAEDGSVWIAHAYAGKVMRYSTDSRPMQSIEVPVDMVTSLCFGGHDMRTVFIVTGIEKPDAGGDAYVYSIEVDVAGAPVGAAATPTTARNPDG
jgi:gluconolactonase